MDDSETRSALGLSQKAVYYDQGKRYEEAIFCYTEAANKLLRLIHEKKCLPIFRRNVKECIDRAEFLKANLDRLQTQYPVNENIIEDVEFLMLKAEILQENVEKQQQVCEIYEKVVEKCLNSSKTAMSSESRKIIRNFAEKALGLAEKIHERNTIKEFELNLPDVPVDEISKITLTPADDNAHSPSKSIRTMPASPTKGGQKYTKEELAVLSTTSNINNRLYVPFHAYDKFNEFKGIAGKFTDPDGKISLTLKQKNRLKSWKRASELFENPCLIQSIDSAAIKQTVISDCSFISSLSIAALYEKKFKKRLVTSIIFPQDSSGKPLYNPAGKYVIRLHINGVWRKVVIDDYFPCDERDQLMCSQSERKGELWVSLLEKAYMKVMGGYDFPGSNSNIDLNALTGWIPERISIDRKKPEEFDADKVFRKLFDRMHRGDCLITLATGRMTQEECDRAGLVETHAYAVLDMRCVDNIRLFQLKNPWKHLRWKGKYSDRDKANWTSKLRIALNYNPEEAEKNDDGIFWIDYDSVINFFDVFYVNWNSELFPHTSVYHATWNQCSGPVRDIYTVGDNPQYSLSVNNRSGSSAVWILLTRHITRIDDFAVNKEYITVMVYETKKKVYIPSDPAPISSGVRINSPHYLCQMLVTKPGINNYTLVVAQYEKTNTIHYSLRVYSTTDFVLEPIKLPYTVTKTLEGIWEGSLVPEKKFPIMKLTLNSDSDDICMLFELKAPKEFSVALEFKQVSSDRVIFFETQNTGPYRPGYTVLQMEKIPAGIYYLKLATFTPGQKGPFILNVDSTCKFDIEKLHL
ncbi:unnamed protein product [Caenorhabditis bovis]|uniref:Calpain catalytic domain-containing protein n=1 Tax=Caenorhabditis bovis TaxID=2654633 RepID=A0A8S1EMQ2_9PELO|nr:unnamed protein product [Caenorhabditis bovis]